MSQIYKSLSIAEPDPQGLSSVQKIASLLGAVGLVILVLGVFNFRIGEGITDLLLSIFLISAGVVIFAWDRFGKGLPGIRNNDIWASGWTGRGLMGWFTGIFITSFYVVLYWFPGLLGLGENGNHNAGLISIFDPLSYFLKQQAASQWFVYGALYTLAILIFGVRFIFKYRHNRYQVLRTCSVMFFQLGFAFLIPELMQALHYPYYDFKNMWPLNYYFFDEWSIRGMLSSGSVGMLMIGSGLFLIFVLSPILTYYYGKRWYCSWVCGCGGLAETAGDPYRQLSDKSLMAWQIERWMIHGVLVFVVIMTTATLYSFFHNNGEGFWLSKLSFSIIITLVFAVIGFILFKGKFGLEALSSNVRKIALSVILFLPLALWINYVIGSGNAFFIDGYTLRSSYGFLIGAAFSGVIGVGFYPIMGSRVWCRFGCPMAAILGIQQRYFSRFRITTNGGQCISCGNCSTYCEMGIDVRAYAQKGQDILRASCVGCGVCSAVCPRGVLKLENRRIESD